MPANGLIVIAGVKPGSEQRLGATLNCIGNDIKGKRLARGDPEPHIDFPSSRTTHFARLALLDDPDRGPGLKRLLLVTDYDGPWREHVLELFALTTDPDAIWGCCVGYAGRDHFPAFIDSNTVQPQAYYIAFRGMMVERIRRLLTLRADSSAAPVELSPSSWRAKAAGIVNDLPRLLVAAMEAPGILMRRGPVESLQAARRVNGTLNRVWWVRWFNRLTRNAYPVSAIRYSSALVDTTGGCSPATPEDEVTTVGAWEGTPPEDLVSQNQLTLVSVVRPEQLPRLEAVLEIINLYARRLATPGSLVGISTIHTVRWALIDGGKRLMMASNYDGTWENYIDEFAEMILSGLDAIWESSYGFPTLGAQDLVAFKQFLRCHQLPANVFYSAYPTGTVMSLVDAQQLKPSGVSQP